MSEIFLELVMFDPEKEYDISFADLLYSFVRRREKRMLFSDIVIMPWDIIHDVGGWNDLNISEDISYSFSGSNMTI